MIRIMSAALIAATLAGCTKPAADPKADADAIKAVEDQMRAAYKAKDAAKLVAAYAPDATLYLASDRPRVGAQALLDGAKADMADPALNVTFTTAKVAVAVSGGMGYTQGSFNIRYTNPTTKQPSSYSGYYLTVFRKQSDGSWKAVEDMSIPAS